MAYETGWRRLGEFESTFTWVGGLGIPVLVTDTGHCAGNGVRKVLLT